jgi:hypothetical protein
MMDKTNELLGRSCALWVAVLLTLCVFPVSAADRTLFLSRIAAYRDPGRVQQEVREECRMDEKLPAMLRNAFIDQDLFSTVNLVEDPSMGSHDIGLVVSIVSLDAPPGGGWGSNQKFMKIRATLYRSGTVAGNFYRDARAKLSGSIFKNVRGNCHIVDRLASQLVKGLAEWMDQQWVDPRPGSADITPIPGR